MFKAILATFLLAAFCFTAEAATVRARSGATAQVAAGSAGKFQCLIDRLEGSGVSIKFMGGYRAHGSVRGSLHPSGRALDINQYARNVTRPHVPAGIGNAAASACGLIHGAVWRHADGGHFQDGGWAGSRKHRHHRRHHRR